MAKRSQKKQASGDHKTTTVSAHPADPEPREPWFGRPWLGALVLILAVILTYQPVWSAGYVWDDDIVVTANPAVTSPSGLKDIWTTRAADICPLTITTFWIEHAFWGLAPLPYHLVNVLMQAASAVLLWRVLRALRVPGAWLGAALWALHPVMVESVAWVTEMKNTQSGLFYLLSILFFIRWMRAEDQGRRGWNFDRALTLLFAALALASKSSTVVLPAILCLCAWWIEGRWRWRNLLRIAPVIGMALAAGLVSLWTQRLQLQAEFDPQWIRSWPERVASSGDAIWFYLGKLAWPYPLMAVYPRWKIEAGQVASYLPLLVVAGLLFFLWLKRNGWGRPWFFTLAYFVVAVLPASGLLDNAIFRYSLVFDHFQYLASMGPLAMASAGLVRLGDVTLPHRPQIRSGLAAGLLLLLAVMSWCRAWAYEGEEALWSDALEKNPEAWIGHSNLGNAFLDQGQADQAMVHFQQGLVLNPRSAEIHYNLGDALVQKGQMEAAMAQYRIALDLRPDYAEAHNNLGNILFQLGHVDESIAQFREAVRLSPTYFAADYDLANVLSQEGRTDEAIANYQAALKIDPAYVDAHNNLGNVLLQEGQIDEAIVQFQEALRLQPGYALAESGLARAQAMRENGRAQ